MSKIEPIQPIEPVNPFKKKKDWQRIWEEYTRKEHPGEGCDSCDNCVVKCDHYEHSQGDN